MKKDWEIAVKKFLEKYKDNEFFVGALVSGSYITGTQTKNSDLDLHIIMSDRFHFREKGAERVEGFLISYVAYPKYIFHQTVEINFLRHQRIISRFFAKGKIIYDDKNKTVEKLQNSAKNHLQKKLEPIPDDKKENGKYIIQAILANLETLQAEGETREPYYDLLYYRLLDFIFYTYSMYLRTDTVNTIRSFAKLYRFFNEPEWNKDYFLPERYPDESFVSKFQECLKTVSHENIEELSNYVVNKMGGFDAENWKIRVPLI